MNDPGNTPRRYFAEAIAVQPLGVNDIASVRRLQISSFLSLAAVDLTEAEADAYQVDAVSDAYTVERYQASQRGELLGAFHDGRLIGTVEWLRSAPSSTAAQIRGVFVDPLFAGCGVGSRLIQDVEHDVGRARLTDIGICSTISAVGFFERVGFHVTSYGQRALSPSQTLKVAFLRKDLIASPPAFTHA